MIKEHLLGKDHPHTAVTLVNLGEAWLEAKVDNALNYQKSAYEIFLKCFGESHPYTKLAASRMEFIGFNS